MHLSTFTSKFKLMGKIFVNYLTNDNNYYINEDHVIYIGKTLNTFKCDECGCSKKGIYFECNCNQTYCVKCFFSDSP